MGIIEDIEAAKQRVLRNTGLGPDYGKIANDAVKDLVDQGVDEQAALAYVERKMQQIYGGRMPF